jgi:hypothetical protein
MCFFFCSDGLFCFAWIVQDWIEAWNGWIGIVCLQRAIPKGALQENELEVQQEEAGDHVAGGGHAQKLGCAMPWLAMAQSDLNIKQMIMNRTPAA